MSDDPLLVPVSTQGEWAAKRFYGDPQRAAAYLPVAYALLGLVKQRMAFGGVSYGIQMAQLPDGTRIRVIHNSGINVLEIDATSVTTTIDQILAIFLEGGWCSLVPIEVRYDRINDVIAEDIGTGKIYATDPTRQVLANQQGSQWFDFVDLPIGEKDPRPPRDYADQMPSLALPERKLIWYTDDAPPEITDYQRKMGDKTFYAHRYFYTQTTDGGLYRIPPFRPSTLTGKMKLLFQSVLARKAPTHGIITLLGQPTLSNSGIGLYTTADYRYYAIFIESRIVYVANLLFDPAANEVRSFLLVSPLLSPRQKKRVEAVLLSRFIEVDWTTKTQILELPDDMGDTTLAYGWKFSWLGHTASIVLHTGGFVNGSVYDFRYVGRLYHLSFTEKSRFQRDQPWTENNVPLTAQLEAAEASEWYALDTDLIWFPERLGRARSGVMERMGVLRSTWWGSIIQARLGESFDAPLYCFYEHSCCLDGDGSLDSSLRVLRYAKTIRPEVSASTVVWDRSWASQGTASFCWPGGEYIIEGQVYDPDRLEGFYVTHSETDQRRRVYLESGPVEVKISGELNGRTATFFNNFVSFPAGCGANYITGSNITAYGGLARSEVKSSINEIWYGSGFVIIPYFSAEAVYVAKKQVSKNGDYRTLETRTLDLIAKITSSESTLVAGYLNSLLSVSSVGLGVSDGARTTNIDNDFPVKQEFIVRLVTAYQELDIPFSEIGAIMQRKEFTDDPEMTLGEWNYPFTNPVVTGLMTAYIFNVYGGVDKAMFYTADISEPEPEDQAIATEKLPDTLETRFYGYFLGSS